MKNIDSLHYESLGISNTALIALQTMNPALLFISMFKNGKITFPHISEKSCTEIENALKEADFLPGYPVKDDIDFLCTILNMKEEDLYCKYHVLAPNNCTANVLQFYNKIQMREIFKKKDGHYGAAYCSEYEVYDLLNLLCKMLSDNEFRIIQKYFGISTKQNITQSIEEISKEIGRTSSYVNRTIKIALIKLRRTENIAEIEAWFLKKPKFAHTIIANISSIRYDIAYKIICKIK